MIRTPDRAPIQMLFFYYYCDISSTQALPQAFVQSCHLKHPSSIKSVHKTYSGCATIRTNRKRRCCYVQYVLDLHYSLLNSCQMSRELT